MAPSGLHTLISFLVLAQSSPCVSVCIVCAHLPQTLRCATLTNNRWLRSDTVGGSPHNGENQCKIHIVATHIETCKTKHTGTQINSSVPSSHTDTCNEMDFSKGLLGSCVCPVCQFLLLTSTSSDNLSLHFRAANAPPRFMTRLVSDKPRIYSSSRFYFQNSNDFTRAVNSQQPSKKWPNLHFCASSDILKSRPSWTQRRQL